MQGSSPVVRAFSYSVKTWLSGWYGWSAGDQVQLLELAQYLGLGDGHVLLGRIAGEGKVDLEIVLESTSLGEDQDAIGELDCFTHVVGDEKDRVARLLSH